MSEFVSRYGPGLPPSRADLDAIADIKLGSRLLLAALLRAYPERAGR